MSTPHWFDTLLGLPDDSIRLDCAALHLARDEYPTLNVPTYLSQLDELAQQVAELRPGLSAPLRLHAMREVLVEQAGFVGNMDDYFRPQNSYLNEVLKTRVGIPISLALVWIEVGRRLKWPVSGVAFPGHFLVRFDDRERFILVDVFDQGRSISADDCRALLKEQFEGKLTFEPRMLEPASIRTILARMLLNLRSLYLSAQDWPRLMLVLKRLAAVEPDESRHVQELAALQLEHGMVGAARQNLLQFLLREPEPKVRTRVEARLNRLHAALAELN